MVCKGQPLFSIIAFVPPCHGHNIFINVRLGGFSMLHVMTVLFEYLNCVFGLQKDEGEGM